MVSLCFQRPWKRIHNTQYYTAATTQQASALPPAQCCPLHLHLPLCLLCCLSSSPLPLLPCFPLPTSLTSAAASHQASTLPPTLCFSHDLHLPLYLICCLSSSPSLPLLPPPHQHHQCNHQPVSQRPIAHPTPFCRQPASKPAPYRPPNAALITFTFSSSCFVSSSPLLLSLSFLSSPSPSASPVQPPASKPAPYYPPDAALMFSAFCSAFFVSSLSPLLLPFSSLLLPISFSSSLPSSPSASPGTLQPAPSKPAPYRPPNAALMTSTFPPPALSPSLFLSPLPSPSASPVQPSATKPAPHRPPNAALMNSTFRAQ
ncbi:unnamed protein product, partial [Closterium sp. NIES-53]